MPSNSKNTNIIGQLRGKHDPHYKLASRVDVIENQLTDLPKIHSTLSKSFGMQRKTLRRVMGLEGTQSSLLFRVIGLEEVVTGDARKKPKGEPEGDRPLNMLDGPGAFDRGDRGGRYTDGARQKVGVRDDWGDIDDGWSGTSGRDGAAGRPLQMLDGPCAFDRDGGFRRTRIRAEDLKRGSSQETIEERLERLERNEKETREAEIHSGSIEHIETTTGIDAETGEPLSAEERKKRFKIRTGKIRAEDIKKGTAVEGAEGAAKVAADTTGASALAIRKGQSDVSGSDLVPPEAEGEQDEGDKPEKNILSGLGKHVSKIADTVDSIYETLQSQFNEQKDTKEDARVQKEQKDAEKQEKNLEKGGLGKGIQKAAKEVFKPFTSIWDKFVNFLKTILVGKVVMKILDWFGNPENTDRAKSLIRFLKDWWPVLLASVMAFMPALLGTGGMIIGTVILLAWAIPKIIDAVKWVMNVPNMIGNFLKGGAKDTDKLEKDSLKELESETKGLDPTAGEEGGKDPLDEAKAEQGGEKPPLEFDKQSDLQKVEPVKMNEGGSVPGKGDKDTVPAMLTPGEFVMSKDAVEKYGAKTLAGMNAAAGGTNIPTLGPAGGDEKKNKKQPNYMIPHFSGGGKQKSADEFSNLSGTGVVTDPKKKKAQEDYMLHWVNKERVEFLGLPPLEKLTYAQGVELTEMMGPGPKTTETMNTHFDFDKMLKTTARTKTRGDEMISDYSVTQLTEEDKQQYLASNPSMRLSQDLLNEFEMDELGADISASAKMNGGGLVPAFNGGGLVGNNLVQYYNQGGIVKNMFGGAKTAFNMLPQVRAAKWLGGKAKDMFSRGKEFVGNALDKSAGIPPPSTGNKVKVLPLPAPGAPPTSDDVTAPPATSIPSFSVVHPGNKTAKQKTLGITN